MLTVRAIRKKRGKGVKGISSLLPGPNSVRVGFWKGETNPIDIEKAIYQEFGTRGGASGGGWGGPIPERPFMRNALRDGREANRALLKSEARRIVLAAVRGASAADAKRMALRRLGIKIQGDIQASIASLTTPPNSPVTIALKGSSKPLIDTGKMSASAAYMVED